MHVRPLRLAVFAALLLCSAAVPAAPRATAAPVKGTVAGVPLSTWTERWWRWADGQVRPPYQDRDGKRCGFGQEGPVWFLAGTDGSFSAKRRCTVPEGKHLLVPIINMVVYEANGSPSCRSMRASAAVNNDHLRNARAELDGVDLGDLRTHRVTSDGCFALDERDPRSERAAADGYWLMLPPLAPGVHTLRVTAQYGGGPEMAYSGMHQVFEYELQVGGRSRLALQAADPAATAAP